MEELDDRTLKHIGYTKKGLLELVQKIFLSMNYSEQIKSEIPVGEVESETTILEEDEKFKEIYKQIKETYKVKISNANWESLVLGEITIPPK